MTDNNELVTVAGGLRVLVEDSFRCPTCDILCHINVRKGNTCGACYRLEQERLAGNEDNDRGNYESDDWDDADDYGPGGIYEDPAVAYERERGEAFQDRVDMWRREY